MPLPGDPNPLLLAPFGAAIGLIGSVLGVGGGIFVVPVLVLALGVPMHQAIAVSLAAIVAASSAVASVNVERGLANMRLGVTLEVTTAAGSICGALASGSISHRVLQITFALALFPVAAAMLLKSRSSGGTAAVPPAEGPEGPAGAMDSDFFDPSRDSRVPYRVRNLAPASILSFFAGGLSGLLGLGGGIIQVPVMTLVCGVPMKAAAATSNFLIGVSAAASAFIYFRRGYLDPDLAAPIVVGVLIGSFAGIKVLYRAPAGRIQAVFSVFVLAVAVKMLWTAL